MNHHFCTKLRCLRLSRLKLHRDLRKIPGLPMACGTCHQWFSVHNGNYNPLMEVKNKFKPPMWEWFVPSVWMIWGTVDDCLPHTTTGWYWKLISMDWFLWEDAADTGYWVLPPNLRTSGAFPPHFPSIQFWEKDHETTRHKIQGISDWHNLRHLVFASPCRAYFTRLL